MNARNLVQILKDRLESESEVTDSQIQVAMIGNSKEARANVMIQIEGKLHIIEVSAKDLGFIESPVN